MRDYRKEIEFLTEEDASWLTGLTKRQLLLTNIPKVVDPTNGSITYRRESVMNYLERISFD